MRAMQMTNVLMKTTLVMVVMFNCTRCLSLRLPRESDLSIFTMDLKERGKTYQEIVGIDSRRQLEFFGVPALTDMDEAEFLLDFKQNLTMTRIPRLSSCFIANGIYEDLPSPTQLKQYFQQSSLRRDSIATKQSKWRKTGILRIRRHLNEKMKKLCQGYPIYRLAKETSFTDIMKREDKACDSRVCHVVSKCYQRCIKCAYRCKPVRYCYKIRC